MKRLFSRPSLSSNGSTASTVLWFTATPGISPRHAPASNSPEAVAGADIDLVDMKIRRPLAGGGMLFARLKAVITP